MPTDNEMAALKKCIAHLGEVAPDQRYAQTDNPNRGRCYLASVALLQYLDGRNKGYSLVRGIDDLGVPHYWVWNAEGEVLDPTADQYEMLSCDPPYSAGRRIGYRGNLRRHLPILNGMILAPP